MTAAAKPPRARLRDSRETILATATFAIALLLFIVTIASVVDAYAP